MSADWDDTGWTCYARGGYRLEVFRAKDGRFFWKAEATKRTVSGPSYHNGDIGFSSLEVAQRCAVAWADTQSHGGV